MSKIIPSEEVADCRAWSVPDMKARGKKSSGLSMTAEQLEEVRKLAHQEGFQQGREEGREAGASELAEKLACMEQMLRALERPFEQLDDDIERQLAELAITIARQLIRREMQTDPGQVIAVVREALSLLPVAAREVRLVLNPEDVEMVREVLALQDNDSIQVVSDPVQGRGGCRILSEASQIDASVETRLNAVIANVLGGQRSSDIQEE